ncbi:uncharacterized protein [Physcomitrium patens]|uniref:Uncharacterized protein n=1 Tax=Physcomitrium patens TaxID=3218 RepID=A0A2K1K2V3_PHYPA|nr:uncharacterized protein LOC112287120 [Physcomitrium patens]PNR48100.1 hypothetical protein PHYPA_012573 [Physcomitrium patens]|eukprot:XP_024385598.1 uncharacterized protein LOC112287120 [Physcomitrella patens]
MAFDAQGLGFMTLGEALGEAEQEAIKSREPPNLESVLTIALVDAQSRHVKEIWCSVMEGEMLDSSRKLANLVALDSKTPPQAVGYALVQACREGYLICVRRLREIQGKQCGWSLLVALFNAFGILKVAEAGHVEVVQEMLRPMESASTALMGFMLASRWRDKDGSKHYPFVENPENFPTKDWMQKVWSSKALLPQVKPIFQAGWNLMGQSGAPDCFHDVIRSCYGTYLVWRVSVVAASQCHSDVFRILLKRRWLDNLILKETLSRILESADEFGSDRLDSVMKKIIADRAKMDTLMYQLVEEYSTKNYHDAMLYTLWKNCVSKKSSRDDGKPKCQAEAVGGIWEIKLDVPLMMMTVAYAAKDEEPKDRYKHLTMLYAQTAQLSIQLLSSVVLEGDFL